MSIKLNSALGGSVTLNEPATASAFTLTLPTDNIQPGMNLITPTSVVGGTFSGGAISFSAATSVSVNGCFTSVYQSYVVTFGFSGVSANHALYMRMRVAGIDDSTATSYLSRGIEYVGINIDGISQNQNYAFISRGATAEPYTTFTQMILNNPFQTVPTVGIISGSQTDGSSVGVRIQNMRHSQSISYDGLTIYPSAGNITGTLRIYGMRNQ